MARNPARYLSKYLSKVTGEIEGCDYENHADAIPRQWQSRSAPMRRMVEFYTGRLPGSFADFLSREWKMLEGLGLGYCVFWHPPSCDRYEILTFYPKSLESLMLVWERYMASSSVVVRPARPDLSDEVLAASFAARSVEVHQQNSEVIIGDSVAPLEDLRAPDTQQMNLFKRDLDKSHVVPC